MGCRKKRKGEKKARNRDTKSDVELDSNGRPLHYHDIIRENASFELYYKAQDLCSQGEEWSRFLESLRSNLPTSFRITGTRAHAQALLRFVKSQYFKGTLAKVQAEADGRDGSDISTAPKITCLPWYPDNLGWQLCLSRSDIRRSETFVKLHNFLIAECETGSISRQEAVSMIPALLLDVQPQHKVLDLCAAPGSKTAQLIECLHAKGDVLPEGFVIANDVNNKRCYMLVHQAKRLQSPCVLITNNDGTSFPNVTHTRPDGSTGFVKYDRILCDVPCSGDGTFRKNPDGWPKWNIANGNNMHGIQSRLLKRACDLLAVGGRVVYSTCSLNPIENEAVICNMLNETQGCVELVDISSALPDLKSKSGLDKWVVMGRDMTVYSQHSDVPEKLVSQIRACMFPPSAEDAGKYNLHRCIRILPHYQDTGGFFVAVLEKKRVLPWEKTSSTLFPSSVPLTPQRSIPESSADPSSEAGDDMKDIAEGVENGSVGVGTKVKGSERDPDSPLKESVQQRKRQKRKHRGYREDPFYFVEPTEPIWLKLKDFYVLDDTLDPRIFLYRCLEGKRKHIYVASSSVRDIVLCNSDRIKIINTGVKSFVHCDNKGTTGCEFRLAQEGVDVLRPFVKSRIATLTYDDVVNLLTNDDINDPPEISTFNPDTQDALNKIDSGSLIVVYQHRPRPDDDSQFEPFELVFVCWKGKNSIRAYVQRSDRMHFLRIIGADVSKLDVNKFEGREKKPKDAPEQKPEVKDAEGIPQGNETPATGNESRTDHAVLGSFS